MEIEVLRSPGDVQGDDVIEPLLCTDAAGVARGTAELDGAHPARSVTLTIGHRDDVRPGQVVGVFDDFQGESYQGLVTAVEYAGEIDEEGNASRVMTVDLRAPNA